MKKITFIPFLLLLCVIGGCRKPNNFIMKMPDTMPPLLKVEAGLPAAVTDEEVLFEKYIQTRSNNAEGNRLYANGDLYKIYKSSNQNLKTDDVAWKKAGTLSESHIAKLKEIVETDVMRYLAEEATEKVAGAIENRYWYFYFDNPVYAETQLRRSTWKFWKNKKDFSDEVDAVLKTR